MTTSSRFGPRSCVATGWSNNYSDLQSKVYSEAITFKNSSRETAEPYAKTFRLKSAEVIDPHEVSKLLTQLIDLACFYYAFAP